MTRSEPTKHLLDTSVLRPILIGSTAYRQYFKGQLGGEPWYVTSYVLVEFRRSYLRNIIAFYFYFTLPTVKTIGDAFQLWSHKFKGSELKAIIQLVGQLVDTQKLALDSSVDMAKAQRALGRYIKRLDLKVRRQLHVTSKDSTECARAQVPLEIGLRELTADLERFVDAFDNTRSCRNRCSIDHFILERYRVEIEGYIEEAKSLPRNARNRSFIRLVKELGEILQKGPDACSCSRCERIGDAVIALDADRSAQIEHADFSFSHLCPPINQRHRQHPSETVVLKQSRSGRGRSASASPRARRA